MAAIQRSGGFLIRPVNGLVTAFLAVAALTMSGCAQREPPDSVQTLDAPAATGAAATADTPVDPTPLREKLETDDPAAGMNNRRPDSQKDVKPEPGTPQP